MDIFNNSGKMETRIKQIRKHFGLTQVHFAQRLNVSSGYISFIEKSDGKVSDDMIKKICTALPVNEEWLRTGNGEMTSSAPVDKGKIGTRIREIRKSRGLTQKQFASEIGYTELHIHLVEAGKIHPSDKFLHEVASAFNIRYEWIITGDGDIKAEPITKIDERLVSWLLDHPEVIRELMLRSGLN